MGSFCRKRHLEKRNWTGRRCLLQTVGIENSTRPLLARRGFLGHEVFHEKDVQWEGSTTGIQEQLWSVPHTENGTGITVGEPHCPVWEPWEYARGSLYGVRKGCRCDDRGLCRSKASNKRIKCTGFSRGFSVTTCTVLNESKLPLFIPTACRKEIGGFWDLPLPFSLPHAASARSEDHLLEWQSPFHFVLFVCSCLQFCRGCNSHLLWERRGGVWGCGAPGLCQRHLCLWNEGCESLR